MSAVARCVTRVVELDLSRDQARVEGASLEDVVLSPVRTQVAADDRIAVTGANGAGRTSLLRRHRHDQLRVEL